ncbi:MAG: hypothetical protein ACRC6B_03340 [Fusobacteriaceae bacterium]
MTTIKVVGVVLMAAGQEQAKQDEANRKAFAEFNEQQNRQAEMRQAVRDELNNQSQRFPRYY